MSQEARQAEEREFPFSDQEFRFLSGLVNERTGIVLGIQKKNMVYSRLVRRLRALALPTFAAYCTLVQDGGEQGEMGNLVNAITTNLTSFFREKHHFDHLRDTVLSELVEKTPAQKRLRLWSAACSAGMESYSMAMTVKAALKDLRTCDARILATDIDTEMVKAGAAGTYPVEQYEKIPDVYKGDVAHVQGTEKIQMSDPLKSLIAFKQLNLLKPWPMQGEFDAIFCRNVAIYFDKPTQVELFSRMADRLKPGGWLYIGHSENLYKICDRFELLGRTIYRKVR